jgi:hypothetical protein
MAESGTENLVVDPCQYLKQELPVFARGTAVELRKADQEQTVWLLRNCAGRSHASLEFEPELRAALPSESEVVNVRKWTRVRRRTLPREGRLAQRKT